MSTTNLNFTPEEIDLFHKKIGLLVAASFCAEYSGYMEAVYDEKGKNYLRNKCSRLHEQSTKMVELLGHDLKMIDPKIREVVEFNLNLVYDTLDLEDKNQQRVYSLVKKLRKEEKEKDLAEQQHDDIRAKG